VFKPEDKIMIANNRLEETTCDAHDGEKSSTVDFNEQFGKSFEAGLGALQQVFAGFVKMAQNAVGPELVRNIQAASWLGSVAECLDAITNARQITNHQAGEIDSFVERCQAELNGSRFASQIPSFLSRLSAVAAVAARTAGTDEKLSAEEIRSFASAAGYFRASAGAVMSFATDRSTAAE
jgi:hypothetical protein